MSPFLPHYDGRTLQGAVHFRFAFAGIVPQAPMRHGPHRDNQARVIPARIAGSAAANPVESDLFEVGEFFHQLLHAVTLEEHGELGVFAFAFAHQDLSFAVFGVADALALLQAGCALRFGDVHCGAGERAGLAAAEEAGDVVDGVRGSRPFNFW